MKKDRKIKSAGMSDRDKNLLFIVGGILLVRKLDNWNRNSGNFHAARLI